MTLKFFNRNVSRMLCSVSLLAVAGCGPQDSDTASPPEQSEQSGVSAGVGTTGQALSTIAYRSSSTASGTTRTSLSITKPAGTVAGDVLLARIINRNVVAAVATPPAGWTFLRSDQSASQIKAWIFYKVATASEPTSYAFTLDLASYMAGSISAFSGVDPTNPIDAQTGQKNGTTASFNTPALTTSTANGVAVWFGSQLWTGSACPASPIVPPAGFTEPVDTCHVSSSTGMLYNVAHKELTAAGAQGAFNGSSPFPNTNIAQVVALRAVGASASCSVGDTFATSYTIQGSVASPAIVEPSGLAMSRLTPGVLYVHNEDTTAIVAISTTDASTLGTFNVSNVTPADWEDVASGPCPTGQCIYMGDIGRSSANFPTPPSTFAVYRIPEPNIGAGTTSGNLTATAFPFQYPDSPKDAETIMVHPTTGDIYIVTKSYAGASKVYKFPQPLPAPGTMSTLVFVANIQLPTNPDDSNFAAATSGNIHPCANRFLLRTYRKVYEFRAAPGAAFETAFAATPVSLTDTVEGQGEAIEYDPTGTAYYTMSESGPPFRLRRVVRQ
ncbi:cell wall anchor protein [Corallococcus sp. BB11-1]|uniref:cell wall anchor protein n=1 Tax=Corallococcus sp. BB11-1 TaxID=2996783 RepID=UPI00226EA9F5|nr:cell wall anchor protein [Corallococcus sp. BB11-1]MCY1035264.1 cell wall anchor protein [Corallococcus sp. BB11-1]